MIIITNFGLGDTVKVGPHEGRIQRILVGSATCYLVGYWDEGKAQEYIAFEWELTLIKRMAESEVKGD